MKNEIINKIEIENANANEIYNEIEIENLKNAIKNVDSVNANAFSLEFKNTLFKKSLFDMFLMSKNEMKLIKNEIKLIKNIDFISNIIYDNNGTKNATNIKKYHLQLFIDSALKFTKNGFDKILNEIDIDTQIKILQNTLLDSTKLKNNGIASQIITISNALTIIKLFIVNVITTYNAKNI